MREKNGFTLVELLITIAMLAVVGTIIIYNTINLTNDTKDLQYERLVDNIKDATRTYVSLYPQDFSDLYNVRAFTYITVGQLIDASLIDDELENPYTKQPIDRNDQIKIYVDGASYEMVYVYPVTEKDKNNEVWLQTNNMTVEIAEDGISDPIYLYDGIFQTYSTNALSLVNEDGVLISTLPEGFSTLLDFYKSTEEGKGYSFSGTTPSQLRQCSSGNATTGELVCGEKTFENKINNKRDYRDFFYATQAGTYYITYKWKVPGSKTTKTKTRVLKVIDYTEKAQQEATTVIPDTPDDDEGGGSGIINDPYYSSRLPLKNVEINPYGTEFNSIIDTELVLFKVGQDRDFSMVMVASDSSSATTTGISSQYITAIDSNETTNYPGFYLSTTKNNNVNNIMRIASGSSTIYSTVPYTPNVTWKIVFYKEGGNLYYNFCNNFDISTKACKSSIVKGQQVFTKPTKSDITLFIGGMRKDGRVYREPNGMIYDFRVYDGSAAGKAEVSKM